MSTMFKQITGGDKVTIENKYEKAISLTLETKFVLTTNRSIGIINDEAERRRIILVDLSPKQNLVEDYEEKLETEGPAFLLKCKKVYEELYDKKINKIICDYSCFEEAAASFEEPDAALFDLCFTLDPNYSLSAEAFANRIGTELGRDNIKIGSFKEWLFRTHKIKRTHSKEDKKKWVYSGIRLKPY